MSLCSVKNLYSKFANRTFLKFGLTGLSGVFVNLGAFQLMLHQEVHELIASPIAIELSIISNFLLNNYWTFGYRSMTGTNRIRGLKFHLVSLWTLVLSYGTFTSLRIVLPSVPPVVLQGCAIVPAMLFNFTINTMWTFREKHECRSD